MPSVWLVSDTHFGHEKICTVFKRADGTPLRLFARDVLKRTEAEGGHSGFRNGNGSQIT